MQPRPQQSWSGVLKWRVRVVPRRALAPSGSGSPIASTADWARNAGVETSHASTAATIGTRFRAITASRDGSLPICSTRVSGLLPLVADQEQLGALLGLELRRT